jgi:outer membrane protein
VRVARDPFTPRITVGSGLAYANGFPMSIEGSAPSVVQARASQFLFNRRQSYVVAQARENARGAAIDTTVKREEVVYRVAALFLDAERAARIGVLARKELESLEKVAATVEAAVEEGRELPLNSKRAQYNVARARQAIVTLDAEAATAETNLALALGFSADDRVAAVAAERAALELPVSEDEAVQVALEASPRLKKLQSQIAAKELEVRGERAARLPRVDLVAQYGLLARFNHYEDYYRAFQRHNGQVGVSVQIPVLAGPGVGAEMAQTQTEVARLRIELNNLRNRISGDLREAFREVRKSESAREVARLDLDVAREQVSVVLAQVQEGRAGLRQLEEARVTESDKWIGFYDAQYVAERARWAVLRHTGRLQAALQ